MDEPRPDSAGILFPPPLVYVLGFAAGYELHRIVPVALLPPAIRRPVGWALVVGGLVLVACALYSFRRAGQTPHPRRPVTTLLQQGPYRFTRNPMYLSLAIVYLGLTALANDLWPLVVLPVVLLIMTRAVIAREEAYLDRVFGGEYRAYRARVRRWM